WGDGGELQVQRSAAQVVRWAVQHLEKQFFPARPAVIFDIFLFKDATSYRRHAMAMWGDEPSTPYGYASATNRALVMDISTGGGTLVHEMVHPYIDANFPNAPTWINEGLASLFEQSDERDGEMVGLTNWRLAGLNDAFAEQKVKRFAELVAGTDAQFRDEDESVHYAQARYLMLYLQERGLLKTFVKKALGQQKKDPTGATALRETLGAAEWKALDANFKKWVSTLHFP
ncbi:MAG: DUF1570 domain-containing protein, partial [Archangium sp.]|nr:DUF1570 domain-containing protein [Archangium sp.]